MLLTALTGAGYGPCAMIALSGYQPPCDGDDGNKPRPKRRQKQTRLTYDQYTRSRLHLHVIKAETVTTSRRLRVWMRRIGAVDTMGLNLRVRQKSAQTPPLRARIRVIAPNVQQNVRLIIKATNAATRQVRHRIWIWRHRQRT